MEEILVICEANVCRSVMAEALFRTALPNARVMSAGLDAIQGMRRRSARGRVFRMLDESDVNNPYREGNEAYESMWQAAKG